VNRFRERLVFKADRLFVSLNYRLESNNEKEEEGEEEVPSGREARVWLIRYGFQSQSPAPFLLSCE